MVHLTDELPARGHLDEDEAGRRIDKNREVLHLDGAFFRCGGLSGNRDCEREGGEYGKQVLLHGASPLVSKQKGVGYRWGQSAGLPMTRGWGGSVSSQPCSSPRASQPSNCSVQSNSPRIPLATCSIRPRKTPRSRSASRCSLTTKARLCG